MSNQESGVAVAEEVRATVNQRSLFSTMKHMFGSSYTVLSELMQNARRAGASYVAFGFSPDKRTLTITDNGGGISDFAKLLALCESGWDEQTLLSDKPFGMGFFSVFFACEKVTIRSHGKILSATLKDIESQRALPVQEDAEPISTGTFIELHGLSDKLMETCHWHGREEGHKKYVLFEEIRQFAMGFPIQVFFCGVEFPRPHALQFLKHEVTPMGCIHEAHIHSDVKDKPLLINSHGRNNYALYLQGLPIQGRNNGQELTVIHLDTQKFIPTMPDRRQLFDADEALKELEQTHRRILQTFLVKRKAEMEVKDFVAHYWGQCIALDSAHLLNDIPLLPATVINVVAALDYGECFSLYRPQDDYITREQIKSGQIKFWRDVPTGVDDENGGVILKIMQREEIRRVSTRHLDAGHWIFQCTPSCDDMQVEVTPAPTMGELHYYIDQYQVTINLVESSKVVITSTVDPAWRLETEVRDDWLMVNEVDEDGQRSAEDLICYVNPTDKSPEYPVSFLSSFVVDDRYDEDWEDRERDEWNAKVKSLRGSSMHDQVLSELSKMTVSLGDHNIGQLGLLHCEANWDRHLERYSNSLKMCDLNPPEFWQRLADTVNAGSGWNAESMREAFVKAANIRLHIGGPKDPAAKEQ